MSRTGMWTLAGCGVLVALAVAAGCARDIGDAAAGDIAGPNALREGSRVSGAVIESLVLPGASGPAAESRVSRRSFSATVTGGRAEIDGAVVATSRGLRAPSHEVEFTDREGRRARIVVSSPGAGLPIERFQVYRDAQLLAEAEFSWQNQTGVWVLAKRALTVYDHGRPVLFHVRSLDGASVLQADAGGVGLGALARLSSVLLPAALQAHAVNCWSEATMTVVAASAVGAATAAFIAAPSPVTYAALVTAIAFYDKTMDAYVKCLYHIDD